MATGVAHPTGKPAEHRPRDLPVSHCHRASSRPNQPLGVTSHPVSLAWLGYWFVVSELSGAPRPPGAVLEPESLADGALFSVWGVFGETAPAEVA
jgi:hypothetical protein